MPELSIILYKTSRSPISFTCLDIWHPLPSPSHEESCGHACGPGIDLALAVGERTPYSKVRIP